jgi:prophage regulatory protein
MTLGRDCSLRLEHHYQLSQDGGYISSMSKPIEEMVAVLWEAMLRQIETRIEERIEAALAAITKAPIPISESTKSMETVHRDRPAEYFISLKEVSAMVGLSRTTIYNLEKTGAFPKKIHVSPYSVRYKVGDIREWMKSLENKGKTKKEEQPEVLTERQRQRLMRLALKRVPKSPPKALPYYTMGDVMKLAGLTHSQIYDVVRDGSFPKWKKTGWPAQQWDRGAVEAWIEARKGRGKIDVFEAKTGRLTTKAGNSMISIEYRNIGQLSCPQSCPTMQPAASVGRVKTHTSCQHHFARIDENANSSE